MTKATDAQGRSLVLERCLGIVNVCLSAARHCVFSVVRPLINDPDTGGEQSNLQSIQSRLSSG